MVEHDTDKYSLKIRSAYGTVVIGQLRGQPANRFLSTAMSAGFRP
jgi:hypothetical protein